MSAGGAVDEDFVAVIEQRLHRIAFDPDCGKLRAFQPLLGEPAAREAEGVERPLAPGNRPRAG